MKKFIKEMPEDDAKSILFLTMLSLKQAKEAGEDLGPTADDLYSRFMNVVEANLNNDYSERIDYEGVHIVCGESTGGSFRVAFGRDYKIIDFPDLFNMGPLWLLHTEEGRKKRYEWLVNHINYENDYFERIYRNKVQEKLQALKSIPEHLPIYLWTGENASEQVGIRYAMYLLKDCINEIYLINSMKAYNELFCEKDTYATLHTSEIAPEKLKQIFKEKHPEPLTKEDRSVYENEWMELSATKEVLRVWENGKIQSKNVEYFDSVIIDTVAELHRQKSAKEFIKCGRVIGEVYGSIDEPISDSFLEYRIMELAYQGVLEIKGVPKNMRSFSVRLK